MHLNEKTGKRIISDSVKINYYLQDFGVFTTMEFWDQGSLSNLLPRKILKNALGFIILMDATDQNSLASAKEINSKLEEVANKKAIKVLAKNKIDQLSQ